MCPIDSGICKCAVRVCFHRLNAEGDKLTMEQVYNALADLICTFYAKYCSTTTWRDVSGIVMRSAREVLDENDPRLSAVWKVMRGRDAASDV